MSSLTTEKKQARKAKILPNELRTLLETRLQGWLGPVVGAPLCLCVEEMGIPHYQ
jgi:hypothetical protein